MTETVDRPAAALATTEPTQGTLKATALASFVPIEAHLTTLAARYDKVAFTDLATPKGLAAAKAIRLELREQGRFAVQRLQKRLKDEANDLKRIVDDRSEEIIAIIRPVEDNAHAQIEAEEVRRAEAKAEKERLEFEERARLAAIEAERVAGLQASIAKIRGYVARCQEPGMTSERIAAGMTHLGAQVLGDEWGDHLEQARAAQSESLAAMASLHASALAREEEAARLEAQRIENERVAAELAEQRAKLAAQQAELDRQAAERAEQSRLMQAEEAQRQAASEEQERIEREGIKRLDVDFKVMREMPDGVIAGATVNATGQWYAADGTFMNADGTRSIFCDVDDDGEEPAQQQAFVARHGDSPVVPVGQTIEAKPAEAPVDDGAFELPEFDGAAGTVEAIPAGEVIEEALEEVPGDPLVIQLAQCRAALADACELLEGWIISKCPKKFAAEHFAHVAKLRDMGGLPRPTTTTTKENN